ncbi:MAG: hydroxyisourate hydrolase [Chthoniobacterales bacterium]|jgi:5-hydroxyisourate hydrolase|nr:hydroxyisourate hydrolase [Chthoniobacterales bacterium]
MEKLTTHVLDTAHGKPAAGVSVFLFQGDRLVSQSVTNADGRCPEPLALKLPSGVYRIEFAVGDYFRKLGVESPFLDCVPVQFTAAAGQSYHVPLVCTPWSYSAYRGS